MDFHSHAYITHILKKNKQYPYIIYIYSDVMKTIQCAHPPHHLKGSVYYALCFAYVEHSACHEPISVLSNIYIYIYPNDL